MEYKQSIDPDVLELVWNNSTVALFTVDYEGKILVANPAFTKLLGWKPEDFQTHAHFQDQKEYAQLISILKSGKNVPFYITKRKCKDGRVLDILASYGIVNDGEILAVGVYKDFMEQMEIQRKLVLSQECYRNLLDHFPYAIFLLEDDAIIYTNQAGLHLVGASIQDEVIGLSIEELLPLEEYLSLKERSQTTALLKRMDGEFLWVEMTKRKVLFEQEYVSQLVMRDITEQKNYEEQLKYFAYHDPLTGVFNRLYFTNEIKKKIEEASRNHFMFGIMFIDLDDFKKVNDSFGHDAGDQLLVKFANRIKKNIREGDILCRIGGDEFLVLIKNIRGKQTLEKIAQRLQNTFQVPYQVGNHSIVVTSSIGIAIFPQDGIDEKTLIKRSDQALYQAKKLRNGFQFYQESQ
ncbi:diguanylate cyclase domain-containing protein [Ureibacillus thermophilus]|uniref:diguanylate cyclase domain-containing protein n=1 Tax=Ureibacillus thermophilus TaxID=367743 RepID=UPI003623FD77